MNEIPKPWVVIQGKVKGKARPRVYNGVAFTPHDTVVYENWVRQCYMEQDGKGFMKARFAPLFGLISKSLRASRRRDVKGALREKRDQYVSQT